MKRKVHKELGESENEADEEYLPGEDKKSKQEDK